MDRRFALMRGDLARLERAVDRYLGRGTRWFDWPVYVWGRPLMTEFEAVAPLEVFDRDGQTVVKLEVPGVAMEDIDVSVTDGLLTIKGEKKHEEETERDGYRWSERTYGSFQRSLAVPKGIEAEKITATYAGGVLEIVLPKVEEEKEHKVKVKAPRAKKAVKAAKAPKSAKASKTAK